MQFHSECSRKMMKRERLSLSNILFMANHSFNFNKHATDAVFCMLLHQFFSHSLKSDVLRSLHPYFSCRLDRQKCFPVAAGNIIIPYLATSSIKTICI